MNTGQTFHTPSFGDEEFEIPAAATSGQVYTLGEQPKSSGTAVNYSTGVYYTDAVMGDRSDEGTSLDLRKKEPLTEPQKPVSAYALFFRDTQAAIKGQNPDASFEEVSKIVTSMWDALDPGHKNVYKKKAEAAKREYVKALAAYRASLNSSGDDNIPGSATNENGSVSPEKNPAAASPKNTVGKVVATANLMRVAQNQDNSSNLQHEAENKSENSNLSTQAASIAPNPSHPQSNTDQNENTTAESNALQRCIREGCTNLAVINADWEDEYCSNECVITHCRNVFAQWVQANSMHPEAYTS